MSDEDGDDIENENDDMPFPEAAESEAEGGIFEAPQDTSRSPSISSRSVNESERFPETATKISSSPSSGAPVCASQPSSESGILPPPFPVQFPTASGTQRKYRPPMIEDERELQSPSADQSSQNARRKVADVATTRPPGRRSRSNSLTERDRPGNANPDVRTGSGSSLVDTMNDKVGERRGQQRPLHAPQMIQTSSAPASIPWLLPQTRAPARRRPLPIPPVTSADRRDVTVRRWRDGDIVVLDFLELERRCSRHPMFRLVSPTNASRHPR